MIAGFIAYSRDFFNTIAHDVYIIKQTDASMRKERIKGITIVAITIVLLVVVTIVYTNTLFPKFDIWLG